MRICDEPACGRKHNCKGLCAYHYNKKYHGYVKKSRTKAAPCQVEGCSRRVNTNKMCSAHHYRRLKGLPLSTPIRPSSGWGWHKNADGYVVRSVRVAGKRTHQTQHRVVMAEMLGRELYRHETPHHKNGQRGDNRPENLELWSTSQPAGQRVSDKVSWAKEFLAQYESIKE